MAVKKGIAKKSAPVEDKKSNVPPGHKPVVIHLPIKLHGAVKLTALATGTNTSTVARKLFTDWVLANKKKAIAFLTGASDIEADEDIEEDTDEDVEEDEDEDEDEE
jgi:hypothetical protein